MRQETRVRTKIFCLTIGALLFELCAFAVLIFSLCSSAQAQQPKKVPRIGYLSSGFPSTDLGYREAFVQGLREFGYVEGKNIVIEYRWARGNLNQMRKLTNEKQGPEKSQRVRLKMKNNRGSR